MLQLPQQLESHGMINIRDKVFKRLVDGGKKLEVCADGDIKTQSVMSSLEQVNIDWDKAHIIKNTRHGVLSRLKASGFHGDTLERIGNENKRRIITGFKTCVSQSCKGVSKEEWTKTQVQDRFRQFFSHFKGSFILVIIYES